MNLYTYILRAVSAYIALFTLCNTAINYIVEYIFITIICACMAVIFWLVADILDEVNSQKAPSHSDNTNDTTDYLLKSNGTIKEADFEALKRGKKRLEDLSRYFWNGTKDMFYLGMLSSCRE